jgi:threonine synthase
LPCNRLAQQLKLKNLWVKDESQLPSGSFKSRGMAIAVSMAKHLGVKRLAIPTAGNAGGALALYAARAGLEAYVFMPADTPRANQAEAILAGAKVFLVNGHIGNCGRIVSEGTHEAAWFDMSTLKEPYRLEGKKTMGLELAEQCAWVLPDVILYPTGGGTGLIGMWKAFGELAKVGWLNSPCLPRMIACQSDGCAPIVQAFNNHNRFAEPFPNPQTIASGLCVPAPIGDFMILDAIQESNGLAAAGKEGNITSWMHNVTSTEGIAICPETAVCFDVLAKLQEAGEIKSTDRVVVFNTGAAQKYSEAIPLSLPQIDFTTKIDYKSIIQPR